MRKLVVLVAALALGVMVAPAQATTYNGNNLTDGTNVCSMSFEVNQAFGSFGSLMSSDEGSTCTVKSSFITPECRAKVHRDNGVGHGTGVAASDQDPSDYSWGNCPQWPLVAQSLVTYGGTAEFRLDLSGLSYRWRNPCGSGDCFVDTNYGAYHELCVIGSAQIVRRCAFDRHY